MFYETALKSFNFNSDYYQQIRRQELSKKWHNKNSKKPKGLTEIEKSEKKQEKAKDNIVITTLQN